MNLLIIIMTDLLVLKLGVSVPLLLDDQEEDTGGDTEDDGEHGDDGGEDDVVEEDGGGRAGVEDRVSPGNPRRGTGSD